MYKDYFLRFLNKEEFDTCASLLNTDSYMDTCFCDVIGIINGKEGYHVNIRILDSIELPEALLSKAINPTTPLRRFAGNAEVYIPTEEEMIQ